MRDEKRVLELKEEIERLKAELKDVTGERSLKCKNRNLIKYPHISGKKPELRIWSGTFTTDELSYMVRKILAPCKAETKSGNIVSRGKQVKDLDADEYKAVCECLDELAEVINKYNVRLHPNGIAEGAYKEGMSLYRS